MKMRKLTKRAVEKATRDLGDGGGLWLELSMTGGRSWSFKYTSPLTRKVRTMGLGPVSDVDIDEARELAREARRLVKQGIDPIQQRKGEVSQRLAEQAKSKTFREVFEAYFADHTDGFKSDKYRKGWRRSLEIHVLPKIGDITVDQIEVGAITSVLKPMWSAKRITAMNVRQRIEAVLSYATTLGWRSGDNPARWDGHLETIFETSSHKVKNHAALPLAKLPAFVTELRKRGKPVDHALELVILTACREAEVRMMKWSEIDLDAATWTIPGDRMKKGREHTVPLSTQAVEILKSLPRAKNRVFDFSSTAMWFEMGRIVPRSEATTHGFRSTFRDWAGDHTEFEREVIEHALAHKLRDKVEASYRRSTALNKRRLMMQAWANHCYGVEAESNVTPMGKGRKAS